MRPDLHAEDYFCTCVVVLIHDVLIVKDCQTALLFLFSPKKCSPEKHTWKCHCQHKLIVIKLIKWVSVVGQGVGPWPTSTSTEQKRTYVYSTVVCVRTYV